MRRFHALLLPLIVVGCVDASDEVEAARVVRRYDEAVAVAYRTRDLVKLGELAEEEEVRRIGVLIDLKSANRLVLESTLETFEPIGTRRVGPDRIAVTTRERWSYRDRPLDPGSPPGPLLVAEMELEWDLVRRDGRWQVRSGKTLSNRYLESPPDPSGAGDPPAASERLP